MQNGAKETANTTAPSISADFLTGSTEIGLDRIRTRLLDLTNRNKLLNFRHSPASSLRVVDAPIDAVFRQLRNTEKLAFMPVPEPDVAGGEVPTAKDFADELGWDTSFDLSNADDSAGSLPVLLYHEHLDTLSRKIASAAKTAIEESGTNMLYLVRLPGVVRIRRLEAATPRSAGRTAGNHRARRRVGQGCRNRPGIFR